MKKAKRKRTQFNAGQFKKFVYWMNERQKIYLARAAHEPFPWTKDKILQKYKFTNVFRQLDRVTMEWSARYARLLGKGPSMGDILFNCGLFRLFNWPETYDELYFGLNKWSYDKAVALLTKRKEEGHQIFTGAYIIPNAGREDPKIEVICEAVDMLYAFADDMADEIMLWNTMEHAVRVLEIIPTVGSFISYEIVCDLRFTKVLGNALDKISWANPGPGAQRGIHRLLTGSRKWPKGSSRPDYVQIMRDIYAELVFVHEHGALTKTIHPGGEFPFEMREVEHSLCEFDKYMRTTNGEGKPRSKFKPPKERKKFSAVPKKQLTKLRARIRREQRAQGRATTVWERDKRRAAKKAEREQQAKKEDAA